jgi:predicted AAA+ superfamily ATPase
MYLPRTLEAFVQKANNQFPVLLVTGARQVGKTTFLQHLSKEERTYVSLDDPLVLTLAKEDPALFMQRYTPPMLIDEIQYASELLPHIKMAVDRDRKPGAFWLTGSQQFHLMKNVSESLAGRVGVVQLLGFSRREAMGSASTATPFLPTPGVLEKRLKSSGDLTLQALYTAIWRGSFPAMVTNPAMDRDLFYSSYVQTYLQRDVRDLARVGNEMAFLRFLRAAAARTGQLLNVAELARDAGVAPHTAKEWLSILQASGIAYLLEPYFTNVTKRFIKTPKLYFLDTGLCAYLTKWSSPETLEAGAMSGPILETWMLCEILKSWWHAGKRAPLHFYRDRDQHEVDLLIEQDGALHPVEFKKTASPNREDVRAFGQLHKLKQPLGPGGLICLAQQALPLSEGASIIPVSLL